jgi:hypothetical protein
MKIRNAIICLTALVCFCLTAIAVPAQQTAIAAGGEYEMKILELVNLERAEYGLSELQWSDDAYEAAKIRAREILTNFSHTRPNAEYFNTALDELNISYAYAAENIAFGYTTPESVVKAWMDSAGHRANILNENLTYLGVAFLTDNSGSYAWVQEFYTAPGGQTQNSVAAQSQTTPAAQSNPSEPIERNCFQYASNCIYALDWEQGESAYVIATKYQPSEWDTNLQNQIPSRCLTVWFYQTSQPCGQ